jgi:hypothetical protein
MHCDLFWEKANWINLSVILSQCNTRNFDAQSTLRTDVIVKIKKKLVRVEEIIFLFLPSYI